MIRGLPSISTTGSVGPSSTRKYGQRVELPGGA